MHVQMRIRAVARIAGQPQQLALRDFLARVDVDLRQMGVRMLKAEGAVPGSDAHLVAVVRVVVVSVRAAAHLIEDDRAHAARGHGMDGRALATAPVNALVPPEGIPLFVLGLVKRL